MGIFVNFDVTLLEGFPMKIAVVLGTSKTDGSTRDLISQFVDQTQAQGI